MPILNAKETSTNVVRVAIKQGHGSVTNKNGYFLNRIFNGIEQPVGFTENLQEANNWEKYGSILAPEENLA